MVKPIQTVAITGASGMVGQALIAELTVMLIHKFAPLPFCADGALAFARRRRPESPPCRCGAAGGVLRSRRRTCRASTQSSISQVPRRRRSRAAAPSSRAPWSRLIRKCDGALLVESARAQARAWRPGTDRSASSGSRCRAHCSPTHRRPAFSSPGG